MIATQNPNLGARLRLTDGGLAEICENPRDGTWLVVCRPASDGDAKDELLIVGDISEVIEGRKPL